MVQTWWYHTDPLPKKDGSGTYVFLSEAENLQMNKNN